MLKDIELNMEVKTEQRIRSVKEVEECSDRFRVGHWCFCGLLDEFGFAVARTQWRNHAAVKLKNLQRPDTPKT